MPTIVAGSNTDAIVAAINAAKSGDRIVHFPTGEYQVTRPIEELANSEGISLTGDKGKSIVHVLTSSSEYGFLVGGARNLTFRNLTFATVNGRSAAQGAFIGREASGGARSCSYVRIFSCEFYQFKQAPWILSAGSEYLWCVGNFIHNISAPGGGSGLSLSNVSHAVYVRNRIEDISSPNSGSHAMNLDGDGVTDVLVLDNSIDGENGPDYGIAITSAVVGCTIDNNQIAGCPSPFVIRDTDADELVVENNSVVLAHGSTAVQVGGTAGRHGNGTGRAVIGNNSVHLPPNAIQGSSIKLVRVESTPMTVLVHHNSIPFGSYLSQLTTGAAQIGPGTLFLDNHYHDHEDNIPLDGMDPLGHFQPDVQAYPGTFDITLSGQNAPHRIDAPLYGGAPGRIMTLHISQDNAGGHTPVWDGIYRSPNPLDVNPAPNSLTTFVFRLENDGLWHLLSSGF